VDPEPSWDWPPGHELTPGLLAWALLGDGRRCETWLAWDLGRWCPVAVKLPRPGQGARAVAGLVQEAAVADDGPFHPVDVLLTGMQLAAALGHLHGRGLAHLDVKPGNVVLRDGRPVLIDLGLARPVGEAPAGGHRRGSPPWMAPEQVRRRPVSPGMDLFALGAVLYQLATGTQAFDPADHGPAGRRWPQLAGSPPPASSRNPEVPAAVGRVVAALLAPDPAGRPATTAQVLALLAAAMPADAAEEDRLWPTWATGRLAEWQASAMARPPLVPRPA
jgi:serine/threonine protein kinase